MSKTSAKRSRIRRAGESAYGLLLVMKTALMGVLAGLLLVAGVWTSWSTAQHTMFDEGRERGTLTVQKCGTELCTGSFAPAKDGGEARRKVSISETVVREPGDRLTVVLRPGTDEALRTGVSGTLYAWMPLAGAMLLASLVIAGGLRLRRTAWVVGLAGLVMTGAAFAAL